MALLATLLLLSACASIGLDSATSEPPVAEVACPSPEASTEEVGAEKTSDAAESLADDEDAGSEEVYTEPEPPAIVPTEMILPVVIPKRPVESQRPTRINDLVVLGRLEKVSLKPENLVLSARIDTGAGLSSLNALELTNFERDGKPWVRFGLLDPKTKKLVYFERAVKRHVNIKQIGAEPMRRPVILMNVVLGTIDEQLEMTLADRSGYIYQVLIGRNFLRDQAVVDVSKKFINKLKK